MSEFVMSGPRTAAAVLMLAHGAGAPLSSAWLDQMAEALGEEGLRVARFNFAYMAARTETGSRKPPPKAETLMPEYLAAVAALRPKLRKGQRLLIGGKSMGGRVASLVAEELHANEQIRGLVCLGYPFHPPDKPTSLRTAHLAGLSCPTLILQGERDPFGGRDEVGGYALSPAVAVTWLADGDHDFSPRRGSGATRRGNIAAAAAAVAAFARGL